MCAVYHYIIIYPCLMFKQLLNPSFEDRHPMVKPCQTLVFEDQRTQRPAGGKLFARLIEVLVTKWSMGGAS